MTFLFENTKPVISDAEMIEDLRAVAAALGATALSQQLYRVHGRFSTTAIKSRFNSWNVAVVAAGLAVSTERDVAESDLFENLRAVWERLGHQPRKQQMTRPLSKYSHHPYVERYGGWAGAIRAFLSTYEHEEVSETSRPPPPRGPRDPSLRLRFVVMRRDGFRCRQCGASPALTPGVELHVDHVLAWSAGGITALDNLQTLCSRCNLGKSDLSHES
jgi:hypothetical protein